MKKVFLLIFTILFLSLSVNAYNYNSTYSNISVITNGWCMNIPITFKLYNSTQYDLNKGDTLYNFTNITNAKVVIYSGPLDSMRSLLNTTTGVDGKFTYNFNSPNQYLLEIFPTSGSNYNDYHQLLSIDECKRSNPSKVINSTSNKYLLDQIFIYNDIKISLNKTDMDKESNISLKNIVGLTQNGLPNLNNVIKTVKIDGDSKVFTNMDIEFSILNFNPKATLKGYLYSNNNWTEKQVNINENKVIFTNSSYGIYSITSEVILSEKPMITPEVNITPTISVNNSLNNSEISSNTENIVSNNNNDQTSSNPSGDKVNNISENSSSNMKYYIIGIIFILVLGIVGYFLFTKKSATVNTTQAHIEVLNTYNEIYNNSKKYVQTYKNSYSKDQIYRALVAVNIPRDIIDKIFLEEFK